MKATQVRFYFRSYISQGDQVGYISGGGTINYILYLDPTVLRKYFSLFRLQSAI